MTMTRKHSNRMRALVGLALSLAMLSGPAVAPAHAQSWLLGKRRGDVPDTVKINGRYRSGDRIRVFVQGSAFERSLNVERAALRRTAEMTRDKGRARFVILDDRCWLPLVGGKQCRIDAQMIADDQPVPPGLKNPTPISVAAILGEP